MSVDYFDAVFEGMELELGSHTFLADEVLEFARQFDPQPFHLDADAARDSVFGGLCASGWHTLSVWMGLNIRHSDRVMREVTGYSGPSAKLGASPGVRNIRWQKPVFVGDTITYRSTLLIKKHHPRREGWGIMTTRSEGFNQHHERVVSVDGTALVRLI